MKRSYKHRHDWWILEMRRKAISKEKNQQAVSRMKRVVKGRHWMKRVDNDWLKLFGGWRHEHNKINF